ncbi:F0F1 ATP synthase subunit alpha, partial [Buchnera aphidicola]|nr:F0F1 ATP synthase subunit alpha [Buchnera aphidicola]
MQLNATEITQLIKDRIADFEVFNQMQNEGTIISVSDGVIRINGLSNVMLGEMISLSNNEYALVLNIERDIVSAVVMGSYINISEGMSVQCTG